MLLFKAENAIENRISPNYEQSYLSVHSETHPLLVPLCVTLLMMLMCVSVLPCDTAWNFTNQRDMASQPDSVI